MTEKQHSPGRFLAGIAGLIRDGQGQYLMLRREAARDFGGEVWECVTGRVNQGEGFEEALYREVMEETGLRVKIESIVGLSHFYRGERIPENELQGVVFGCRILGDSEVERSDEHDAHRWMSGQEALAFLTAEDAGTVWFRKTIERSEALLDVQPEEWGAIRALGVTLD
jgi:8-oxo-dGTP diphosphatase